MKTGNYGVGGRWEGRWENILDFVCVFVGVFGFVVVFRQLSVTFLKCFFFFLIFTLYSIHIAIHIKIFNNKEIFNFFLL